MTKCGPLEKGVANHFSILALRTPWTVWKGLIKGLLDGSLVKNSPANLGEAGVMAWSLGQEDLLEEEMATQSRVLAWRIPWKEEPCVLWGVHGVAKSWTWLSNWMCTHYLIIMHSDAHIFLCGFLYMCFILQKEKDLKVKNKTIIAMRCFYS